MVVRDCPFAVTDPMSKGLFLTIGVFIILNLAWIWRVLENRKAFVTCIHSQQSLINQLSRETETEREILVNLLESHNSLLNRNLLVLDSGGKSTVMNEIFDEKPSMVIYLSDSHCDSCVEQLLFSLKNLTGETDPDRLVVLYSTADLASRKYQRYEKILQGFIFYRIFMGDLNIPLTRSNAPVLFTCDSSMRIQLPFLIRPSMEQLNLQYFKLLVSQQGKQPYPSQLK